MSKRIAISGFAVMAVMLGSVVLARNLFQQEISPPNRSLSVYAPPGAMLYLEAKNFRGMLDEWDNSEEKKMWLKSDGLNVFSQSGLHERLMKAQEEFGRAANLPTGMKFVEEAAGDQSALALYDISALQFLFITRRPGVTDAQFALLQQKSKFDE